MNKFPQEFDTDEELHHVEDYVDFALAAHHNVLKEAIKAIQRKLGINNSEDSESIDFKKINSSPPNGFMRVKNIYLKEVDQEVILKT